MIETLLENHRVRTRARGASTARTAPFTAVTGGC